MDRELQSEEPRPDRAGWLVLALALVILGLSLGHALYRGSLPSIGWSFYRGLVNDQEALVFHRHLSGSPSPIRHGDVLLSVDGRPVAALIGDAFRLRPDPPQEIFSGEPLSLTVLRAGQELTLGVEFRRQPVTLYLRNLSRTLLYHPALLPTLLLAFFVFIRRPCNRIAHLMLLLSVAIFASEGISEALSGVRAGPTEWFFASAYWPAQFFNYGLTAFLVVPLYAHLFLVFPVVKEPVRRYPRLVLALLYGFVPASSLLALVLGQGDALATWRLWFNMNRIFFLTGIIVAAASIAHTFWTVRDPLQRAQVRWLVLGGLITSTGILTTIIIALSGVTGRYPLFEFFVARLPLLALPVALSVAILRYNLFDIDVVINRTLVYSLLTAVLLVVYFASVVVLESLFRLLTGQNSNLAVAVSTFTSASLFRPLRRTFQHFIDRRFYRQRYNAAQTLAAFQAVLREDTATNLETVTSALLETVEETMHPAHLSLWLRELPDHTLGLVEEIHGTSVPGTWMS
jgi:hypothetical protein